MQKIEFEIKGKHVSAVIENGLVYRNKFGGKKGAKIMCGCTGRTEATATHMKYVDGLVYCPNCDKEKEITILKTPLQLEEERKEQIKLDSEKACKARENIHLCFVDQSLSSGLKYYALSTRIDPDEWSKIKTHFNYFNSRRDYDDDEQDTFGGDGLNGWLTTNPDKVEEILKVKPELRLEYRNKVAAEERAERVKIDREKSEVKTQIDNSFQTEKVVKPWADETKKGQQGSSMIKYPEGQEYEDPKYPFNIYGGGQAYIIDKEGKKIWKLINNGADGDNWGLNNVATGGAGAIGAYVEYTEELEELIKKYISLF